jgi:hypothetical protein
MIITRENEICSSQRKVKDEVTNYMRHVIEHEHTKRQYSISEF